MWLREPAPYAGFSFTLSLLAPSLVEGVERVSAVLRTIVTTFYALLTTNQTMTIIRILIAIAAVIIVVADTFELKNKGDIPL